MRRASYLVALVLLTNCGDNNSAPSTGATGGSGGRAGAGTGGNSAGGVGASAGTLSSAGSSAGGAAGVAGAATGAAGGAIGSAAGSTSAAGSSVGGALGGSAGAVSTGPAQTVSGQLYGLSPGESITLQNNAGDDLTLSANGKFSFTQPVAGGAAYTVSILKSPASPITQTCLVWDGTGTIGAAPITDVRVNCDLLAYYPLDGNANDTSGYGHDGVVTGATLTTDRNGSANSAYAFSNKALIEAVMPVGFLPLNDQPRTLTAWLKPSATNSLYGVVYWGAGNCTGLQFGLADQGDKAGFWGGCDDSTSSLALPVGQWSFVAIAYSASTPTTVTLYVNDSTTPITVTPLSTGAGASFVMGGNSGASSFFTGDIDSVRVYGHALDAAEVASVRGAVDH